MYRLLVFIGLCCVTYYIVGDALQGGFTFFGHALPILALALLALFYRPISARLATMTEKLEDIAGEMDVGAKVGDEEEARETPRVDGVGAMDGSAEIRLSPTKEGAPPDGVFMDDKGNVSIRLAALSGEKDRKQFAGDPKKTHLIRGFCRATFRFYGCGKKTIGISSIFDRLLKNAPPREDALKSRKGIDTTMERPC
jgi:hypothetical protein